MAGRITKTGNLCTLQPTRFLDARRRVRALLHSRRGHPIMTFYDETGVQQELVQGLLPVSAILLQMLGDPTFHPEIVGESPADGPGRPARGRYEPPQTTPPPKPPCHTARPARRRRRPRGPTV